MGPGYFFVDVPGANEKRGYCGSHLGSYCNDKEAGVVVQILQQLKDTLRLNMDRQVMNN